MSSYVDDPLQEELQRGLLPAVQNLSYVLTRLSRASGQNVNLDLAFKATPGRGIEPVQATVHCSFGNLCDPLVDLWIAIGGQCVTEGSDTTCEIPDWPPPPQPPQP